ncbi:hypothetical protein K488DRAFT_76864 [Vararia minispora EC-137]|uniref:Uncharacterized protein n=1 Tax=Vararia minispora EC-137 TaxID=1314806 RepID=A0ACB8QTC4_9AGAM|nr:hypothetical protein K488DRAFT_76864 [Vararia minispora EC-137]
MATAMSSSPLDASQPASQASSPSAQATSFHSLPVRALARSNLPSPPAAASSSSSLLDPPPNVKFADFLRAWSDVHVARWLADIKCAHHAATFKNSDIRSDVLLELDQATLKEIGVASIGDRLRILNAVKALRARANPKPALALAAASPPASRSPVSRRSEHGRPPPLQLNPNVPASSSLPHLVRDAHQGPAVRPLPHPQQPTLLIPSGSHPPRSTHLPTAPRSQPKSRLQNGRRTPTQDPPDVRPDYTSQPLPPAPAPGDRSASLLTPVSAQPSTWTPYGLPSDPRAGIAGARSPRSQSPLPNPPPRASSFATTGFNPSRSPNPSHGRNLSASSVQTGSNPTKLGPRPSTGGAAAAPQHPYALTPGHNANNGLSPISESFANGVSPMSAVAPSAFTVGRGPFPRPNTPSHTQAPSLVDLRRKLMKFQLADEGHSATINVEDCSGGIEVLERALKKFGKLGNRSTESLDTFSRVGTDDGGLSLDGWSVYLDWAHDGPSAPLSEAKLLAICHSKADDPVRERGLILRHTGKAKRNKAHIILGASPPLSPIQTTNPDLASDADDDDDDRLTPYPGLSRKSKSTKRASTISVLSGLGVPFPEKAMDSPWSPDDAPSSAHPTSAALAATSNKVRNFFGHRPPSELITTHLREYFPGADRKMLKRTSVLRASGGSGRRDSTWSFNPGSKRLSVSTVASAAARGSHRTSVSSIAPPPPPPEKSDDVPRLSLSTDEGHSRFLTDHDVERTPSAPAPPAHLLPPVNLPTESLAETLSNSLNPARNRPLSTASTSKRLSYVTELRSKKDNSDAASMMTVDEITEQVESRRGSRNADADTAKEELDEDYDEDEDEEGEEEENYEEEDEEDEDEDEDGMGKTHSSGGIKWIKGALIGSGSFGKVYLGMDATNGLLMAVKQVELSGSMNDDRKRSMVDALEREIDLLKNLEHEHIVQYLYSSSDDDHFNIFLEYVPGGSIAALLRNYGAFEEPLVRTFVRQILEGLDYVHERGIVHRDIKGANVLVDNKGGIKISDFGISKKLEDNLMPGNRLHRPSLQGSVFWMAPEVVKQTAYTKKADVWSVGCLIIEMFTGEHPWAQLNQMQAIFKIGSFSAKPPIPHDVSADAQAFLESCFELDHEARPSAGELLKHAWLAKKPARGKKDAAVS